MAVPVQEGLGEGEQRESTGLWGPVPAAPSAWLDYGGGGAFDGSLFSVL